LVGCTQSPQSAIVGTWQEVDGTEVLQFHHSGDLLQEDSGGAMGASYRFVDDTQIRVDFGGPAVYAPPRTYTVSIEDDVLVLTGEEGRTVRYRRVPSRVLEEPSGRSR
jgi:hypothetical protein